MACGTPPPIIRPDGTLAVPSGLAAPEQRQGLYREPTLAPAALADARGDLATLVRLPQLLAIAATSHPALRRMQAEALIDAAEAFQARHMPNPRLDAWFDDWRLTREPWPDATLGLGIHQPLDLSGSGRAAQRVADARQRTRELEAMSGARALKRAIERAFIAYWAADGRVAAAERLANARERQHAVAAREVTEGRRQPPYRDAWEERAATARLLALRATRERADAAALLRRALGDGELLLGPADERFTPASLAVPEAPADPAAVREWAARQPDALAAAARVAALDAAIDLASAERAGQFTLDLQYEYDGETATSQVRAGFGIPLALWDNGEGAVRAATARREAAQARVAEVRAGLLADLIGARERLAAAEAAWREYREHLVPARRRALAWTRDHEGRTASAFDRLDAEAALARAEFDARQAEADYADARSALAALLVP